MQCGQNMDSDKTTQIKPRVAEWFAGRTVLVTGGTGFMGKVLLEKLLRSCSDLERILVLVRHKRGTDSKSRIKQMLLLPLFEKLRMENPVVLEKLCAIEGDMTMPGLGLSDANKQMIQDNVSIVFHCAASVRMDTTLKEAVQCNVLSTLRLLELAEEMKQLAVFLHLSSTFCHCEGSEVGERTYPPPAPPHSIIDMVSWMKDKDLEAITPSLLGAHPNTYTFTKLMAEALVQEKGAKLHAVIARPSIVVPTWRDPIPGWVDTLNGPVGILVAGGKGVLRSMMAGEDYNAEVIPVDIGINCLITIAYAVGNDKPEGVPVYNITQGDLVPITWGEILSRGRKVYEEIPFEGIAWFPDGAIRSNKLAHMLCVIFFHYLPAYFVDFILMLVGQKRFLVGVQRRISVGLAVLQYFTMRPWKFLNDNTTNLESSLCKEDKVTFFMRVENEININEYIQTIILGARQYCMKEPLTSIPRARRHLRMMYYVDRIFTFAMYALFGWLFFNLMTWTLKSVPSDAVFNIRGWSSS